jgi:hypothetical protein
MVKIKPKKKIFYPKKNKNMSNNKLKKTKKYNTVNSNKNNNNKKHKDNLPKHIPKIKRRKLRKMKGRDKCINNNKKKNPKVIIKKRLTLISPFHIDYNCCFFYDIEVFNDYNNFTDDLNQYKLKEDELLYINKIIDDIKKNKEENMSSSTVTILPNIYTFFKKIIPVPKALDERAKIIEIIIQENNGTMNLSLRKIKEIYENKTNCIISIATISYILKYKLDYRYLKTVVKPKILSSLVFKKKSYFLLRIIYQVLKSEMNFIYVDETKLQLKNSNFRVWRPKHDNFNYSNNKQEKMNLILAVTKEKILHFKFNKKNINSKLFKEFINEMIHKIEEDERKKYVIFFDNARIHKSKDLLNYYKHNSIKIVCNVPYESSFNMVELSFRFIKNNIYKKIYNGIEEITADVTSMLESEKLKNSLLLQYKETLEQYIYYHNKYINDDLNGN